MTLSKQGVVEQTTCNDETQRRCNIPFSRATVDSVHYVVALQVGGLALSRSIGDTALSTAGLTPAPELTRKVFVYLCVSVCECV